MAKTKQEVSTCQSRSGGGGVEGRLGDATKGWSPPCGSQRSYPSSQPGGAGQDLCWRIRGDAQAWRRERGADGGSAARLAPLGICAIALAGQCCRIK